MMHASAADGSTVHVFEAGVAGAAKYGWRVDGGASGSAKTFVDAKLDATDAAVAVKATAGAAQAQYAENWKKMNPSDLGSLSRTMAEAWMLQLSGRRHVSVWRNKSTSTDKQIGAHWAIYDDTTGKMIDSGSSSSIDSAKADAVRAIGNAFSASRSYSAFGLSPLALAVLADIVKAGGTSKPKVGKPDSPKALAVEELVTANAVRRNPDGSLTATDAGARWLTQDASLKASAAKYGIGPNDIEIIPHPSNPTTHSIVIVTSGGREFATSWAGKPTKERALEAWKTSRKDFTPYDRSTGRFLSADRAYSASDPAAVCADIHFNGTNAQREAFGSPGARDERPGGAWFEKCKAKIAGSGSAGAPEASYALRPCEAWCMERAASGELERVAFTSDVIDSLLGKGLVESVDGGQTYKATESAVAKYGAAWQQDPGEFGYWTAFTDDYALHANPPLTDAEDGYRWSVEKRREAGAIKSGKAANVAAAKSAAESAARSLGAKFDAGAVEWKCVDPKATTQITSTERIVLGRVNSGSPIGEDNDVTLRTLAQKGLVEMDEDGAYHVTPAGTDALAGGGTANAETMRAEKFADAGLASSASALAQKLASLPSGPKLDSLKNEARGLLSQARSSLARKASPQLKSAIDKANELLSQSGREEGRDAAMSALSAVQAIAEGAKYSASSQSPSKPLKAAAPRIPTGEYLAVYDDATDTYTVKDVPIFAEHQVPGAKFKIGEKWMRAAVQKAKDRATADKYVAPLHIRHHGDGEGTTRAGFVMPTEVKASMYEGRKTFVLYADLVGIPPEVYEDIKARKLPYRSVEINKVDVPEISSLALLEDEVPYFRLPMLGVGKEVDAKGKHPSIAASARRIRQSRSITPCVAYAESATLGRATYLYSDRNMLKLAASSTQSSNGGTQMKRYADMTDEEKDEAVEAKMQEIRLAAGSEEDDEETLRAKAKAALRLADGDVCPTCGEDIDDCACPEGGEAFADVMKPDEPLTEGPKAKDGSPGGQSGESEKTARQFAAMNKALGAIVAGQTRMLKMMAKAYDMHFEEDDEDEVKAKAVKAADPGEDEDEGPVELKASARMAARLSVVEGKLSKAESAAKIDRAVKYALRQLDGYSVGDPEDVEKRIRTGAMKYGEGWIKEYLSDVKKLAPKAPTDDGIDDSTGESVGDLPDEVLAYRARGPEKLERAIRHYSEWRQLKQHGHGTFAKDDGPKRYIDTQMNYSAVDGNGVVRE